MGARNDTGCSQLPASSFQRIGALALVVALALAAPAQAVLDSVVEDFDGFTEESTIDGVGAWAVSAGHPEDAWVQSSVTSQGTGNALRMTGAEEAVTVARTASYGGLTPTWIQFVVRPGLGSESRAGPTGGIGGITFDFSGKILASDGVTWVETGETFEEDQWWEVTYKINFTNHTYDLYLSPLANPKTSFTPVKSGLAFADPTVSSMSTIKFQGAYSTTREDDTFVDDLAILYIERIGFISPAQTLVVDQPGGPFTVQLQNSLLESQRAVEDIFLELKSTSTGGQFSLTKEPWEAVTQVLLPKDSSSVSFYYKDSKEGKPTLSVKEFPDRGWLEALQEQEVVSGLVYFDVLAVGPQTAGEAFPVTITARDEFGQVDQDYNKAVNLTAEYVSPTTGTKILSPSQTQGFFEGKLEVMVTYPDAGAIRVVVTDPEESERIGKSGQIQVFPAMLKLETEEGGQTQVVKQPFALTVTALNQAGEVTPNYTGTVNLAVQGVNPEQAGGLLTPASLETFQAGQAQAQVTYPSWGSVLVNVSDASSPQVTGQSGEIMFHPAAVKLTVDTPPSGRDFFYTGEPFDLEVTVLDAGGDAISNYQGTVTLSADSELELPAELIFTEEDAGSRTLSTSAGSPGTYLVEAAEPAADLSSGTVSVKIKEAVVVVLSTVGPVGGATEVTILIQDEEGNLIVTENEATLNVTVVEANPNESVHTPSQTVQVKKGKAKFVLSNTEAELVTLIPTSLFNSRVEQGTVDFGRFANKGVGILLWREVEEPPKVEE